MDNRFISLTNFKDSRSFLHEALKIKYSPRGKINYADFSRKCSFSSRSFISEYLKGKKKLSNESLRKIISALKLPRNYSLLFRYLSYLDNDLIPRSSNVKSIQKKVKDIRTKIQLEFDTESIGMQTPLIKRIDTFLVYSSLGDPDKGCSLQQIKQKTKLNEKQILEILNSFKKAKVLKEKNGKFYIVSNKLDFLGLNEKQGLVELIEEVSKNINSKKRSIVQDDKNLALFTTVSLNPWDKEKVKKEIQNSIFDILDKYQSDDGEELLQVFTVSHSIV